MSTAEARRAARRRKILENPGSRMNKIFGVEGKEHAPGLEDGNPFKLPPTPNTSDQELQIDSNGPAVDPNQNLDKLVKEETLINGVPGNDAATSPHREYMSPTFEAAFFKDERSWYQRRRVLAAAFIGVCLRLFVILNLYTHVLYLWLIYQITLEVFHRKSAAYCRVPTGPMVNVLLFCGFSQKVVHMGGRGADMISRIVDDTAMMVLTFLLTHLSVEFLQTSQLPDTPPPSSTTTSAEDQEPQ